MTREYELIRQACDTGLGYRDATETERCSRWALDEIDRLRGTISSALNALGAGEDEEVDSPGNMAHAILRSGLT